MKSISDIKKNIKANRENLAYSRILRLFVYFYVRNFIVKDILQVNEKIFDDRWNYNDFVQKCLRYVLLRKGFNEWNLAGLKMEILFRI